jgi:hypothetical protein
MTSRFLALLIAVAANRDGKNPDHPAMYSKRTGHALTETVQKLKLFLTRWDKAVTPLPEGFFDQLVTGLTHPWSMDQILGTRTLPASTHRASCNSMLTQY